MRINLPEHLTERDRSYILAAFAGVHARVALAWLRGEKRKTWAGSQARVARAAGLLGFEPAQNERAA